MEHRSLQSSLTLAATQVLSQELECRTLSQASLVVQLAKNPPAMQETLVQFLGLEDPLEKAMATQSRVLAWKISWTEEPVNPWSCKESETAKQLSTSMSSKYWV